MAIAATGCGDDGDGAADDDRVKVAAATEPAKVFIERMTKLVETSRNKKDCAQLEQINARSVARFSCPAPKELRTSMARFEVIGAEEYGPGAIVDYKSGTAKDGAAVVLFAAPDRNWGIGRFGILTKPSTETSDEESRDGYAKAVDEFLAAIRERDCDSYVDVTFNGDDKKDVVCQQTFPATNKLAKRLKSNPDVKPRYEGGNETFGFYSLEVAKPRPTSYTISIAKANAKGPRPYVVLDMTPGPTAAQQARARKAFQKNRSDPNPDQPETSPSRKAS
jgi:hypothetical protein